jgi:DHA1 family bicyclomycin/chloramphenicol resistance-like MFS transporter
MQHRTPGRAEFRNKVFRPGRGPFIVFLAFLNAFVPISTDLYLPALPRMTELFSTSRAAADLTLSGFMLAFALSMLFWGSVSDRYGRKPVLAAGLILYAAASVTCILAANIGTLIAGRIVQAVGSGAVCAVSMAIVKDVFRGREMENVLIWMQIMTVVAPMIAPSLGSLMLRLTSWRGLFVILLLCSLLALLLLPALKETMSPNSTDDRPGIVKRITRVLGDAALRRLLLLFSLSVMPFMAYLTSSAFIYIRFYGLSEEQFSLFFAANAFTSMLGPLLYRRVFRTMPRRLFLSLVYTAMAASGAGLLLAGDQGPFHFIALYLPLTFFASASRPVGALLMMSQLDSDNGTVAALMGSCALLCGGISMVICSLGFADPILPVACMATIVGLACLALWLLLDTRKLYREP